ncbi:helix-turn-helix domain-containing protein [Streptomyces sp. NPDC014646]|uniref:helix-turn-helix domain-containing protein n=1 Tax=Streptomyces sp. NPDC014646 TaxID=3364877 RepID=UPI0036FF27A5
MAIEDNPVTRVSYGKELRIRREAAGLTQEELSRRAILTASHISHMEKGRRRPALEDAQRLDEVLGTGGIFERFLPMLDGRKVAETAVVVNFRRTQGPRPVLVCLSGVYGAGREPLKSRGRQPFLDESRWANTTTLSS